MKRITSFLLAIVLFAGLILAGAPVVYAASEMDVSDTLVEILKSEEGFSAKPYWDYGQYTVGYGTRCPDDMLDEYNENGITEEEAEVLLRNYLADTVNTLNKKFIDVYNLNLNQGQFDALVSFTYNCGTGWISDTSGTFHRTVKNGTVGSELIRAFSLWCSAGGQIQPGLVRRRLCEANMYLNGVYSTTKPSNYCYVYYNADGGSVSYRIQGYDANEGVAPAYTATYEGHTFLGWFTEKTGGTQVKTLTADLSGTTLYARWEGGSQEQVTPPAEGVSITVTGSEVNLRKGPGTNYSIVGTAYRGDKMLITETATGSGYTWGRDGEKWIALKYTDYDAVVNKDETESQQPEESTEPEATVPEATEPEATEPEATEPENTKVSGTVKANGGLALRKGPGTGYDVIRYLPNGSKVSVTEQKTVGSMTWGYTGEGWISMTYVVLDKAESVPESKPETKPETEPGNKETAEEAPEKSESEQTKLTGTVNAKSGLTVRAGAGTTYAVKRYLNNGTKVTITEVKDNNGTKWGKISDGWICMDYVILDAQKTENNETTGTTGTVTADCLRVRENPGTSAKIVGYYYEGAKVQILETTEVDGMTWGRTSKGWVSMDYVK